MTKQIRACLIPVGGEPVEISLPMDDSLSALQRHVGGLVDVINVKGDGIDLWINDEGLFTCPPNRALYADKHMEQAGYLNQLDYSTPVKEGNLYTVLFGNIVAVRHGDDGGMESLTDNDLVALKKEYADPYTGIREVQRIRQGGQREENPGQGMSLDAVARECRDASDELRGGRGEQDGLTSKER